MIKPPLGPPQKIPFLLQGQPLTALYFPEPPAQPKVDDVAALYGHFDLVLRGGPETPGHAAAANEKGVSIRQFLFPVLLGIYAPWLSKRFARPLNLGGTVTQNEFEILTAERKKNQNTIIIEDQGNLLWGHKTSSIFSKSLELEVRGLILNKPHFYPSLLKRLFQQEQVLFLSGRLPVASPLMPYLTLGKSSTPHSTLRILTVNPQLNRYGFHCFLPKTREPRWKV